MATRSRTGTKELLDRLLVDTSRTFALSIPELPEPTRREVTVAYLLFRIADTFEDATEWEPSARRAALEAFAGLVRNPDPRTAAARIGDWVRSPPVSNAAYLDLLAHAGRVLEAFDRLDSEARAIVGAHTLRTTERMCAFLGRSGNAALPALRDLTELRNYCYAVAGIVGEMLTELFLLRDPRLAGAASGLREAAPRFGEALQLVNILKDSAADAEEGRSFLPDGVAPDEVFSLAREDLEQARTYVQVLQEAGAQRGVVAFTALPVLLARFTLDRVAAQGPGSKLTRVEVARVVETLRDALDRGAPAVPLASDG